MWQKHCCCLAIRLLLTTVFLIRVTGGAGLYAGCGPSLLFPSSLPWSSHQRKGPSPRFLPPHMFLLKVSRSFTGKMGTNAGRTCDPVQTWAGIEHRTCCCHCFHSTFFYFIQTQICVHYEYLCLVSPATLHCTCTEPCYISTAKQLQLALSYGINMGMSFFTEMYFWIWLPAQRSA